MCDVIEHAVYSHLSYLKLPMFNLIEVIAMCLIGKPKDKINFV